MSGSVQFKIGDRVTHRTYPSVEMIVVRVKEADGLVHCEWFDGKARKEEAFHSVALIPFVEESGLPSFSLPN